jgi:hypothetical protein
METSCAHCHLCLFDKDDTTGLWLRVLPKHPTLKISAEDLRFLMCNRFGPSHQSCQNPSSSQATLNNQIPKETLWKFAHAGYIGGANG